MSEHEDYEDIVQVPDDVMGQVIGKGGYTIHQIRVDTGARIERCKRISGFYISGTKQQCMHAKKIIEDILYQRKETPEVLRYIPEHMKGHVIGPGGSALRSVSEETGAQLSSRFGQITLTGDRKARERAHVCLKSKLNGWRWTKKVRDGSNEVLFRAYLEHSGRGVKALFLQVPEDERQRGQLQEYKIINDSSQPSWRHQGDTNEPSDFTKELQEDLSRSLTFAKDELLSRCQGEIFPLAELWCHFGRVHFGRVREGDVDKLWSPAELENEFSKDWKISGSRAKWSQCFKQGVSPNMETLKQSLDPHSGRQSVEEITRWDLNFLSPLAQRIRCKIWLLEDSLRSDTEGLFADDMQHDLYYAVSKISFKQPATQDKACGWLCKSPRPRLKVNVITPEVGIDCRLTVSTVESALWEESDTVQEEYDILRKYLSDVEISPNGGIVLPGALPKDFQLQYKRRSQRTTFTHHYSGLKFSVAVCKETSIETNGAGPMTKVDVYISCADWNDILANGEFEVKEIIRKFPVFWQFVKIIRRVISENEVLKEEEIEDHQGEED